MPMQRNEVEAMAERFVRSVKNDKPAEAIEASVTLFVELMDKLERVAGALEKLAEK